MTIEASAQESCRPVFEQTLEASWVEVFFDPGTGNWPEQWFLDGEKGEVNNSQEGMHFSAGPVEKDNAHHAVLWTRESFSGDIKLEFDFTRTDTVNKYVSIVYLQATGSGEGPYTKDIADWAELRTIPYMKTYFDNMNLLHVSFAAYGQEESPVESSYIRARRYPRSLFGGSFDKMELEPEFLNTGLFHPGVSYHVVLIKTEDELFMNVRNDQVDRLYRWDLSQVPNVSEGRIGFRHMWQRSGLFKNISISQRESE